MINVASVAGLVSFKSIPIYSATKAFVVAATRNFGHPETYKKTKVRFVAVCPGATIRPTVEAVTSSVCLPQVEEYFEDLAMWPRQT